MKILIDESIDIKLKNSLSQFDTYTVKNMGWLGIKNGDLLTLASKNGFDIFLTADRNIKHQQNLTKYSLAVIIFRTQRNDITSHLKLMPDLVKLIYRIEAKEESEKYFEIY